MTQVFSKEWFQLHQPKLIWLANNWLTKRWFRWVLRIRKFDCPIKTKINYIGPNFFTYNAKRKGKKIEATTDFRVNDKFARRLYYAFKPLWWALHLWDWGTAYKPAWNAGFDTLTQYPGSTAAGNPCDGDVFRASVNETFTNIRDGAGNNNSTASLIIEIDCSGTTNRFSRLDRVQALFDTSALTAAANISEAVLSFNRTAAFNTLTGTAPSYDAVSSDPASTSAVANGDYAKAKWGTTPFATIAHGSTANGYNAWTLNASGKSNISKTGISKFGLRIDWDTSGTFGGTWGNSKGAGLTLTSSSGGGTTTGPKLVITYTLPSSSQINALLLGVG